MRVRDGWAVGVDGRRGGSGAATACAEKRQREALPCRIRIANTILSLFRGRAAVIGAGVAAEGATYGASWCSLFTFGCVVNAGAVNLAAFAVGKDNVASATGDLSAQALPDGRDAVFATRPYRGRSF